MNAFRQGRAMGTHLVVGVNSDDSITKCKGPPVMNDQERLSMVAGCKFVDEVVPEVPYVMSDEYVRWMIQKYRIDFVVHGDDPCIVDGRDVYESAVKLGKYRTIPRTEGVSTTEIVGRMLLLTSAHHARSATAKSPGNVSPLLAPAASQKKLTEAIPLMMLGEEGEEDPDMPSLPSTPPRSDTPEPPAAPNVSFVRESKFLTTSRMLRLFAEGCNAAPPPGAKVVYVDGAWDMFHAGHVEFLRKARELGDFLLVGVHNDVIVNRHRGTNFPIMNLNERTLSVLGCKYVSDVVIDPPWCLTREMIASLNISVVAHGAVHDPNDDDHEVDGAHDSYRLPKELGIFVPLPSTIDLTVDTIVGRIHNNHEKIQAKINRKAEKEKEYYDHRYGLSGAPAGK
jgi:ethanolamine-phosphate cytidylyltransferase